MNAVPGKVCLAVCLAAGSARAAVNVNFDDGLGAGSFTTQKSSAATIDYAYDYSTYTYYRAEPDGPLEPISAIPQAPNSTGSAKIGMRMAARTAYTDAQGWVTALPNFTSTGYYRMTFDMWFNYNGGPGGGDGSTEFTIFGLNIPGTGFIKNITPHNGTADGYATAVTGEGGTTVDYRIYSTDPSDDGPSFPKPNATWAAPNGTISPHSAANPYYAQAGLFGQNESVGSPGKSWVEVTIEQSGNVVNWYFNDILITTLNLETPGSGLGKPFIGYFDQTSGAPGVNPANGIVPGDSLADSFVIIDNLVVVDTTPVPEPAAAACASVAAATAFLRRRRR